jgi:predicted small lipoprotein YifL
MKICALLSIVLLTMAAAGCGTKGPLYLPKKDGTAAPVKPLPLPDPSGTAVPVPESVPDSGPQ